MIIRTAEATVADLMHGFRDVQRFEACCRQCPNYGRTWACPPFAHDPGPQLARWKHALVVAARIELSEEQRHLTDARGLLRPARQELEKRLLAIEEDCSGFAFGFAGECAHCAHCARPDGRRCRHPELVRPSLEACGFDVCGIMEHYFGESLQWASGGLLPKHLTLVSAIFHNAGANKLQISTAFTES